MADLGTYDFKKVNVIYGGKILSGFADGQAILISPEGDDFISAAGADGGVDRVKNNANFYNITLRFLQTSESNKVLKTFHNADLKASAPLPLLIKNRSDGKELFSVAKAWIVKMPEEGHGTEIFPREWQLKTTTNAVNL